MSGCPPSSNFSLPPRPGAIGASPASESSRNPWTIRSCSPSRKPAISRVPCFARIDEAGTVHDFRGMLTAQQLLSTAPRRKSIRSLRQQYDLYIMDRIEHYKNSLPRDELLKLADAALAEMRSDEQQFLLTEVLAQEAVDDLIKRRLGIRSFESWRKQYPKLRAAQRDPIHWNLPPTHLMVGLAQRIEPDDPVLVVGSGAECCAYLAAAHDADVTYIDRDFASVERAEHRVAAEALTSTFDAFCVQFGD